MIIDPASNTTLCPTCTSFRMLPDLVRFAKCATWPLFRRRLSLMTSQKVAHLLQGLHKPSFTSFQRLLWLKSTPSWMPSVNTPTSLQSLPPLTPQLQRHLHGVAVPARVQARVPRKRQTLQSEPRIQPLLLPPRIWMFLCEWQFHVAKESARQPKRYLKICP